MLQAGPYTWSYLGLYVPDSILTPCDLPLKVHFEILSFYHQTLANLFFPPPNTLKPVTASGVAPELVAS